MEFALRGLPYVPRSYTSPTKSSNNTRSLDSTAVAPATTHGGSVNHSSSAPVAANMTSRTQSPFVQSQGHTSSTYSIQSQPSSRSSDTTQGTAHSTLFPPPPPLPAGNVQNGGPVNGEVTATDNIMNSVADASSSLFQICVSLRQRLMGVPGFSESLDEEEEEADEEMDPVTLLWRTFRRGFPLMLLYNTLRPDQPLSINPEMRAEKRGKAATFKFLQACVNDLKFPADNCFIVTDLYGDDTTGFVKVARVVNRVLDILVQRGVIQDVQPTASDFEQAAKGMKRSQRQHIVHELVTTERTYVQHLELLQAFKHLVEEKGVIHGDAVHDIFLNLNSLLDFQRRFLIRVEQTNALPEEKQNWGEQFLLYYESFKVYEPYIANQRKCEKTVVAEFAKLKTAGGSIEMRQMVESPTALYGFLMKPFQRLSKYPLLLDDLYKKGDLDEQRKADLVAGREAATSILSRTNEAVDREERAEAVQELKTRVEDWKGHRIEGFGELLLYGTFTVLKSENMGSGKDAERQYHVYLFETIILCCKDIDLNKPKHKLSNKQLTDKRGKPKLQLKGRIFMQNVTDLVQSYKPGSYTCQIFWKGDPGVENFIIRFASEDLMKKWKAQIEAQQRKFRERIRESEDSRNGGTSSTEFHHMQNQPPMENPYAHQLDEDEDGETLIGTSWQSQSTKLGTEFSSSRNASSSSLRSRSTTGESHASNIPPRAPMRTATGSLIQNGLTLRTQLPPGSQSPAEFAGDSYFSPVGESPQNSARTSTSSSLFAFTRQQVPQNSYFEEGHGNTRFTAPAMPRSQRDTSGSSTNYGPSGRGPRPSMHSAQQMPVPLRNRSASSPDIHNGMRLPGAGTRNGGAQPPIPDLPATYQQHPHMIPRSQSNSPNPQNGVPSRMLNNSPQSSQPQRSFVRQNSIETGPHAASRYHGPPPPRAAYTSTPPIGAGPPQSGGNDVAAPTQLKVKVICPSASQVLTLVVPLNISCQSLKDRIDAKLQRSTNLSLGDRGPRENQVKLKYLDEDDFVSIQDDEDVQTAFETWREQQNDGVAGMGEIELYCQ